MTNNDFKIGYLFFRDLWHGLPKDFSYILDTNITFTTEIPNIEDKIWQEWLGLKWRDVKESNSMVRTEIVTISPEILDGENKAITVIFPRKSGHFEELVLR